MSAASAPRTETPPASRPARRGLLDRLFEPVPIAPLVQFRIALGLILVWEAYRYVSAGWPRELFFWPAMLFKYYGFGWVRPLPEPVHVALFPVLGVLAACVALGLFYRFAAALLFVGWAYVFLLDQALYLNHMYLVTLLAGLMALLPAHRAYSLDSLTTPGLRSEFAPRWTVALLRFQIAVPYFFGGIAKLGGDWLSGVPMQLMLVERPDIFGQAAGEPWVALFFAYGGLLFDLLVVPLLYWRKTRVPALLLAAGFHLTNHLVFKIGIFPWTMMAATLILWPPFPLRIVWFGRIYGTVVLLGMIAMVVWPAEGRELPFWSWALVVGGLVALWTIDLWLPDWRRYDLDPNPTSPAPADVAAPPRLRPAIVGLLAVYAAWQVLLPFRHLLYPGDVNWTEEGHKWSWQMKLRIKQPVSAAFFVLDGEGNTVGEYRLMRPEPQAPLMIAPVLDPVGVGVPLSPRQSLTMTTRPELILQFAHFLRDRYEGRVKGPVQVRANIAVRLDGREPAYLVDPEANLAAVEDRLWPPAEWIKPLEIERPKLRRIEVRKEPPLSAGEEGGGGAQEL